MANTKNEISLRTAALIAGLSILAMVIAAPFAELYVFPKLIVRGNAAETTQNLLTNKALFRAGIMGFLITFTCDLLATWALYILLKPVNQSLSLLTAWFRLVYTVIALVALANLFTILRLLNSPASLAAFEPVDLNMQVQGYINAFKGSWYFGLLFFAIHLCLLGFLVFKSNYIPKILGVLLIISGLGYMTTTLNPLLFPEVNTDFAQFTFYGELIFMLWLIIRGSRIPEPSH